MLPEITVLNFPKIIDERGNLTFLQYPNHIPFPIERVFWTYDVPGGETRGGHAFYTQQEVIIALSGSFDIVVSMPDDSKKVYSLNRSYTGIYIPAKTWRHMENFSTNALAFHLSSHKFDENDYLRDEAQWKLLYI
jgi:hypothetical protein